MTDVQFFADGSFNFGFIILFHSFINHHKHQVSLFIVSELLSLSLLFFSIRKVVYEDYCNAYTSIFKIDRKSDLSVQTTTHTHL